MALLPAMAVTRFTSVTTSRTVSRFARNLLRTLQFKISSHVFCVNFCPRCAYYTTLWYTYNVSGKKVNPYTVCDKNVKSEFSLSKFYKFDSDVFCELTKFV